MPVTWVSIKCRGVFFSPLDVAVIYFHQVKVAKACYILWLNVAESLPGMINLKADKLKKTYL